MTKFITLALLSAYWLFPVGIAVAKPPNFVILFADDLGYGDLGCYGHPTIRTPNLDRMAREGIKLTSFYAAAPVCTPSRAALLTGRYPLRSGMFRVLFPEDTCGIPASEITLGEALKTRGYRTMAIGKWHLGSRDPFLPTSHGFDEYYGLLYSNDMIGPPVPTDVPLQLYRNARPIEQPVDQGTLTESYTEEAIRFIRHSKNRPFLLYLPYTMPHVPLFASEKFRGKSLRGLYGDVVETIDWSAGRILAALRQEGLDDNTLVIFTSDNGPWLPKQADGGSAGLLRNGKGTTYEGGMRVPCIARWPGRISPAQVSPELATNMDIFATCLTLAGAALPTDRLIDGKNIMPVLEGKGPSPHESFYYYSRDQLEAVREGKWKLRFGAAVARSETQQGKPQQGKAEPAAELFDLHVDPSERFNRAAQHPDLVARLKQRMDSFAKELVPGPGYEASRDSGNKLQELYAKRRRAAKP